MKTSIFNFLSFLYSLFDKTLLNIGAYRFRVLFAKFSLKIRNLFFFGMGVSDSRIMENSSPSKKQEWIIPSIPDWVIHEMKNIAKNIDPSIYPTSNLIHDMKYYSYPVIIKPKEIYDQIYNRCKHNEYTHVIALPWLKCGGADFLAIKHIEFLSSFSENNLLVFLTNKSDSPWLEKISKNVEVIKLYEYEEIISNKELSFVICRLLVQMNVKVLHIINSDFFWNLLTIYGMQLSNIVNIFVSLYCDDYNSENLPVGFGRKYLLNNYKFITKVFVDNSKYPLLLQQIYGFSSDLFVKLNSPIQLEINRSKNDSVPNSVLWAGRFDQQKRPDILLAIVNKMPDVVFHIYGESVLNKNNEILLSLSQMKNVFLHGRFDGMESLNFSSYSVFLYTSQWDGLPTIVLAAASSGIPIVASLVGGVGDIITNETGYPVSDIENIDDYVNNIRFVLSNKINAKEKADLAKKIVIANYTKEQFYAKLNTINGYITN